MAQSRLEKIGTIFSRVNGLIRANAMKMEDRPIWYDLYVAFPPKLEPRYDRKAPDIQVRNIFYAEDVVRAKYHINHKQYDTINLADTKHKTKTQNFIEIYNTLKAQNPLDEERIYVTAVDMLAERSKQTMHEHGKVSFSADSERSLKEGNEKDSTSRVNIQNLFKE